MYFILNKVFKINVRIKKRNNSQRTQCGIPKRDSIFLAIPNSGLYDFIRILKSDKIPSDKAVERMSGLRIIGFLTVNGY